jgi:hypothetical protein
MKKKPRRSFEVLGPAPAGFGCALCGQGGSDMLQIIHRNHIGLWHRACAQEYFRGPVLEPTKAKNRSRLGSENREWMKLAHLPLKSAVAGGGLSLHVCWLHLIIGAGGG